MVREGDAYMQPFNSRRGGGCGSGGVEDAQDVQGRTRGVFRFRLSSCYFPDSIFVVFWGVIRVIDSVFSH